MLDAGEDQPETDERQCRQSGPPIASCGRCSSESSAVPANVNTLKLTTRPAITRYGRKVSDRVRVGTTATDEFTSCRDEAGVAAVSTAGVPAKKITGSTGRMHGEMPVISPPRKPMSTRVSISACSMPGRSRTGDGGSAISSTR